MANQKSVSETTAGSSAVTEGPIVDTWSHTPLWDDPSVRTRRRGILVGVGLGFLALFGVLGGLARQLDSSNLSCATGEACGQLGVRYAQGAGGVSKDEAVASRLFQRACELGDAGGCNNLGLAFQSGQGVPQDYERAMDWFERACSGGFAEGCNNQGALYEHGQGAPVNLGDAQRLYTQACRHGSGLGCSNLGVLYAQGRGVAPNPAEAARLFREACNAGSSVGCNNLLDSTPAPLETF